MGTYTATKSCVLHYALFYFKLLYIDVYNYSIHTLQFKGTQASLVCFCIPSTWCSFSKVDIIYRALWLTMINHGSTAATEQSWQPLKWISDLKHAVCPHTVNAKIIVKLWMNNTKPPLWFSQCCMMWISQWGSHCIEEFISIFSLSNTQSEGRHDYVCGTFCREQWERRYLCSFAAQNEQGGYALLSEVIVMVKYRFC